jgi:DNA-binding response OmpR family regulator
MTSENAGKILIVDDEPNIRHTLSRILQQIGCEVNTAESGKTANQCLQTNQYDLVYLDLQLPDIGGIELLRTIKSQHNVPVILFTAHASLETALQAIRLGATDYLLKPVDPRVIQSHTQKILAKQQREQQKKLLQSQIDNLQKQLLFLDNAPQPSATAVPKAGFVSNRYLQRGNLKLDVQAGLATWNEISLNLPPTAFDYLVVLASNAPEVVPYQTLVEQAQGYKTEGAQAQDLAKWHIHTLRDAIDPVTHTNSNVVNVRGVGYRLVVD